MTPDPDHGPGETDVSRLRAEIRRLERQLAKHDEPGPTRGSRTTWWRPALVALLMAVAVLSAPLSVVAVWARGEIGDTDRYVQTVTPLASDPAVQQAIAARVTDEIFTYVPVDDLVQDALEAVQRPGTPERLRTALTSLARPVNGAIRDFVESKVEEVVESSAFQAAWIEANRSAHQQMVAVLTGEGTDNLDVDGDSVQVDLAAVIQTVKNQLVDDGFSVAERIPAVSVKFTVFQSQDLGKAQRVFAWLDAAATWLPLVGLSALLGAVALSRHRRSIVLRTSVLIAVSMVLLGVALNIFRPIYLDAVPPSVLPTSAAASVYDTVVLFLRQALRAVAVVSLAVALVAWFTSQSGSGASARASTVSAAEATRRGLSRAGLRTGRVGSFVSTHRGSLHTMVALAGAALYLAQAHPTGRSAVTLLVGMLLAVLLIELIASPELEKGVTK